jgi:hypothetical protein|tara:strand:- start:393 stop:572 length:180 start_codon:yes stop_codon:yes gene_type:complete
MILYKGKAKDYSLKKIREQVAKRYGVIVSHKSSQLIGELELTCQTSRERLETWTKKLTT